MKTVFNIIAITCVTAMQFFLIFSWLYTSKKEFRLWIDNIRLNLLLKMCKKKDKYFTHSMEEL